MARKDRVMATLSIVPPLFGAVLALSLLAAGHGPGAANLVVFLLLWLGTLFGIEGGYHRLFSHHSYAASPGTRRVIAILGSMAFQGPILWWVATHRRHHKHADRPGDPHSPSAGQAGLLRGLLHAHVGWLYSLRSERPQEWMRFAPELFRDREMLQIHVRYGRWVLAGLLLPALVGGLASGHATGAAMGLLWGGLVRITLVNHAIWAINSLGHRFGRRDYMSGDTSGNLGLLAIPTAGASWHNNHHAFPGLAICGFSPWQIDLSGTILGALERLGLVTHVRRPTPALLARRALPRARRPPAAGAPREVAPPSAAPSQTSAERRPVRSEPTAHH
jgi:stearoyl-CoA desaturase (delta-9 desaturase)